MPVPRQATALSVGVSHGPRNEVNIAPLLATKDTNGFYGRVERKRLIPSLWLTCPHYYGLLGLLERLSCPFVFKDESFRCLVKNEE